MSSIDRRGFGWWDLLVLAVVVLSHPVAAWSETAVTTHGITFHFDSNYSVGRFVDGEPWVVANTPGGGVRITAIDPAYSNGKHGFEVNRTAATILRTSLDDRIGPAFDAPPSLPRTFAANDSILKVISYDVGVTGCNRSSSYKTCLEQASVLTVLAAAPPANSFRPPFFGTDKPIFSANLDLSVLPKLPPVAGQPSIANAEAIFGGVWLDHIKSSRNRYGHPGGAIRTVGGSEPGVYGTRLAISITAAMLRTMHDDPDEGKRRLANLIVQYGIDTYYLAINDMTWPANGGIHMGRKAPVLYAGLLLQNQDMLNVGRTHGGNVFQEDGITHTSEVHGEALWGERTCGSSSYQNWISNDSGGKACADPQEIVDGSRCEEGTYCDAFGGPNIPQPTLDEQRSSGKFSVGAYQRYTSMYFGIAAIGRLLRLEPEWNHDAFFDYTDRMASPPWNYYCGAYCDTYLDEMHRTVRGLGELPPLPPASASLGPPTLLSD